MKHHRTIVAIHWLTVLLVIAAFAMVLAREAIEDSDSRRFWLDVHRTIGLLVLALVVVRAGARAIWGREPVNMLPPAARLMAGLGHVALYGSLMALPLLGWAQSSARSQHFRLFGWNMPSLIAHDPDMADQLANWHEQLAWIFLALIGLHAAAALWHHYVRRDNVLRSMLP